MGLYKHFLPNVTMDVLFTARKSNWLQVSASLILHGHQLYRASIDKTISLTFFKDLEYKSSALSHFPVLLLLGLLPLLTEQLEPSEVCEFYLV